LVSDFSQIPTIEHFVQYFLDVDKNAHHRNAPVMLQQTPFYGRVLQFFFLTLPLTFPFPDGSQQPVVHVVALVVTISQCPEKNRLGIWYYRGDNLGPTEVVDISCIESLVGRVKDHDMWALAERNKPTGLVGEPKATNEDSQS
jgi:hypothetical protein